MSILSDLNPQNTRLQTNRFRSPSIKAWCLPVLPLLLAGVAWWLYSTATSNTDASPSVPASAIPSLNNKVVASASDAAASHAEIPKNAKGSAVILISSKGNTSTAAVSPPAPEALAANLPPPLTAAVDETKLLQPAQPPAAKRMPKPRTVKDSKAKRTRAPAYQAPQSVNAQDKNQERDTDIISVMIR